MSLGVVRRLARSWPWLVAVGAAGLVAVLLLPSAVYPRLGGHSLGYYVFWLAALLLVLGAALGVLVLVSGPKRALLGMALGAYVWRQALHMPDEAATLVLRDSVLLSAAGAYLLATSTLATMAHALLPRTGQAKAHASGLRYRPTASANGVAMGTGAWAAAGAAAATGLHAGAGYSDDDDAAAHDPAHAPVDPLGGGPSVNIDGTPMVGGIDIYGRAYGVTDDAFGGAPTGHGSASSHDHSHGTFSHDSFSHGGFSHDAF